MPHAGMPNFARRPYFLRRASLSRAPLAALRLFRGAFLSRLLRFQLLFDLAMSTAVPLDRHSNREWRLCDRFLSVALRMTKGRIK
jgi:hypothetical protein